LPDALVISEPVAVSAEINTLNGLADYAAATNPESEGIKLDAYRRINVKHANNPPGWLI
jgi:hypothetical protein